MILLTHTFHIVSKFLASEARIEIANSFTVKIFLFFFFNFQTGTGAHLAFYSMDAMDIFWGYKETGEGETNHPFPTRAKGAIQGAAPPSELQGFSSLKNVGEN